MAAIPRTANAQGALRSGRTHQTCLARPLRQRPLRRVDMRLLLHASRRPAAHGFQLVPRPTLRIGPVHGVHVTRRHHCGDVSAPVGRVIVRRHLQRRAITGHDSTVGRSVDRGILSDLEPYNCYFAGGVTAQRPLVDGFVLTLVRAARGAGAGGLGGDERSSFSTRFRANRS